jgi:hypothetical protein
MVGMVMIKCPDTGHPASTGIEIDGESFARLPDVVASMSCSACGRQHLWRKTDAWLSDASANTDPASA